MAQSPLTIGEFSRWAESLQTDVREIRKDQIAQGLDIAVLKDRAEADKKVAAIAGRNHGGVWGAIGGLIGGFLANVVRPGG